MIGLGTLRIGDIGYFTDIYGRTFFGIVADKIAIEDQKILFKTGQDLLIVDLENAKIMAIGYSTHSLVKLTDKEYNKLKTIAINLLKIRKYDEEFVLYISGVVKIYSARLKLKSCRLLDINEEFFPE